MAIAEDLLKLLSERLVIYRQRFIEPYIPVDPDVGPEKYELDVKAYCLLTHAAFEQYFEELCLSMMTSAVETWTLSRKLTDCLLMLLARYGMRYELSSDDDGPDIKIYDHVRLMAEEVKRRYSRDIHENHGIPPKYLRSMLVPVGLDFNPDANTTNSLCKLAQERGEYAHRGFLHRSLAPEDAEKYVDDCFHLAEEMRSKAEKIFP